MHIHIILFMFIHRWLAYQCVNTPGIHCICTSISFPISQYRTIDQCIYVNCLHNRLVNSTRKLFFFHSVPKHTPNFSPKDRFDDRYLKTLFVLFKQGVTFTTVLNWMASRGVSNVSHVFEFFVYVVRCWRSLFFFLFLFLMA